MGYPIRPYEATLTGVWQPDSWYPARARVSMGANHQSRIGMRDVGARGLVVKYHRKS